MQISFCAKWKMHHCNIFCYSLQMKIYCPRGVRLYINFKLSRNTFANVTKEGLTWVEWITREIMAVIYRSITEAEKVMFICSMNHLMCRFNCTGGPVGILRHILRARSNKTAATSFTQSHFWHSQNPISKGQNTSSASLSFPKQT